MGPVVPRRIRAQSERRNRALKNRSKSEGSPLVAALGAAHGEKSNPPVVRVYLPFLEAFLAFFSLRESLGLFFLSVRFLS